LDKENRLYLHKYWKYEEYLNQNIRERVLENQNEIDFKFLTKRINELFENDKDENVNWQRVAAYRSVVNNFSIISGGPGTGKTTTVTKILVLLIEEALNRGKKLNIALAAPTGKAASRLKESIIGTVKSNDFEISENVKELIPKDSYTINRLLKTIYGTPSFIHGLKNKLQYNLIVVDESSMVDLSLMTKFLRAVPSNCRVIFLGDRDQLASVESGVVLGDICDTGEEKKCSKVDSKNLLEITGDIVESAENVPPLADVLTILRKSYRFKAESGIWNLANAINNGDSESAISMLTGDKYKDIELISLTEKELKMGITSYVKSGYNHYIKENEEVNKLELIGKFSILCGLKKGPFGSEEVNQITASILKKEKLVDNDGIFYHNQIVMVTGNDYVQKLSNGDTGLVIKKDDKLKVCFSQIDGTVREIVPSRLNSWTNSYAMTVHKSQGSEFEHVLVVLPNYISKRQQEVLSRELLYTAVTRAKKKVTIVGDQHIIEKIISQKIKRNSGLRDKLWGEW